MGLGCRVYYTGTSKKIALDRGEVPAWYVILYEVLSRPTYIGVSENRGP